MERDFSTNAWVPLMARTALSALAKRLAELEEELRALKRTLLDWHRQNAASPRLAAITEIGVISARVIVAAVSDSGAFRSGRQFAAWLGLVPKQNSSGGK